jgi:hypothetical protein
MEMSRRKEQLEQREEQVKAKAVLRKFMRLKRD